MDLIDFTKNENSIAKYADIESLLLYGNPEAVADADITICIPTYKRPALLKEAIESAVNQATSVPYRIIVVDNDVDPANTEVLEIVKSFNDRKLSYYKNTQNLQMCGNWNRCVVLTRTKWTAFLHDDDLLLDNYIEEVSKVLHKHGKKIKALCMGIQHLNFPCKQDRRTHRGIFLLLKKIYVLVRASTNKLVKIPFSANFFGGYGAPTCGMVFSRDTFLESGGFNQAYYPYSPDRVFQIFYHRRYNFYRLKKFLGYYRWEVNTFLRQDVQDAVVEARRVCLLSLKNDNKFCNILFHLLYKDINLIMKAKVFENKRMHVSMLFRIISLWYNLIFDTEVKHIDDKDLSANR
jgi:glycosyltransferase involved in cell wall biosynthesis